MINMNIIAQIVGIVAMFFSVFSFQMNKHKQIMIMQIIATALFGVQYFMLGAYTGMALDAVGVVRGLVFYHRDKAWASHRSWVVLFAVAFAAAGIITWQGPVSLLMTIAMVMNTFSFSFTKPKLVRSTILLSSPLLLIYNVLTGSIGGVINEACVEASSVIGLIRYDIKGKISRLKKVAETH